MGLRVLHVIGGGDSGGAMTHLLPLLSALQKSGCDVHLLCLGGGSVAEGAARRGLSVRVLPMGHAWDASVVRPLGRLVSGGPAALEALWEQSEGVPPRFGGHRPSRGLDAYTRSRWDVVHTHGMRANIPVRLVMRAGRNRPCLFTTIHSDLRLDYTSSSLAHVYEVVDRITLPSVDVIVCVSEALRNLLERRGYPAQRLTTIRSGIEQPKIGDRGSGDRGSGATHPSSQEAPADDVPRLGTIARLVPVKDVALALEVAALLRRTHPRLEVVVVGDGPEATPLEMRAEALGLADAVRFTGRMVDASAELRRWDLYLMTSTFEGGVSMAVLEAMAAAIPVVTTAAGGVEEAVKDGETGFVVNSDRDRDALAAALAERAALLLGNPELRARMGAAGAQRVRDEFGIDRTARATIRAYERCLVGKGALL